MLTFFFCLPLWSQNNGLIDAVWNWWSRSCGREKIRDWLESCLLEMLLLTRQWAPLFLKVSKYWFAFFFFLDVCVWWKRKNDHLVDLIFRWCWRRFQWASFQGSSWGIGWEESAGSYPLAQQVYLFVSNFKLCYMLQLRFSWLAISQTDFTIDFQFLQGSGSSCAASLERGGETKWESDVHCCAWRFVQVQCPRT